jgi:hypothetical protein
MTDEDLDAIVKRACLQGDKESSEVTVSLKLTMTEEARVGIEKRTHKRQCHHCKLFFRTYSTSQLYCCGAQCDFTEGEPVVVVDFEVAYPDRDKVETKKDSQDVAEMDDDSPPPTTTCYVDADYAECRLAQRSQTGVLLSLHGSPTLWYSHEKNALESSTFGSELIAMRTAIELNRTPLSHRLLDMGS